MPKTCTTSTPSHACRASRRNPTPSSISATDKKIVFRDFLAFLTPAFAGDPFHYSGQFRTDFALRNAYIDVSNLGHTGPFAWVGSRMYRGDDVIDGFRIDTVKHVEHAFWQEFCQAVRDHATLRGKRNFVMFGEIFDGNDAKVSSYTRAAELDAVVNFPAKYQVFEDVIKFNREPTKKVQTYWAARAKLYPAFPAESGPSVGPANLPFNFLDNHDVPCLASITSSHQRQ